jgi:thiamine kinase-like enzyme
LAEVTDLQARVAPYTPTLCHNDMMPGNLIDDGDRLWVIDWEYAGIGQPWFDVAGIASNCRFDDDADRELVATYGGRGGARSLGQFRVFKAMAALRESLWAVLQGSQSEIAFDYAGYRDDNFACYRRARERALGRNGRRAGP